MAISEGTQPAAVQWSGVWNTGNTKTSASFTPESGALLVVLIAGDGNASNTTTATVSDSVGGTNGWVLLRRQNANVVGVVGGTCEVWCKDSPAQSMTVSVVSPDSSTFPGGQFVVRTLIGAQAAANQAAAADGGATTQAAAVQVSVAAGTGNMIYGAMFNFDSSTVMTMLGNTTAISQFSDTTNVDTWEAFKSSAATAGTATYGSSTSHNGMIAAAEILAVTGSDSGPNAAGAASDLGGGSGSWTNPSNATGAANASYAVWTAP